jgi:anti-anti-sigma factor
MGTTGVLTVDDVQVAVVSAGHDVLVLQVEGELDIATADTCRARLSDTLAEIHRRRAASNTSDEQPIGMVVLDLTELTFLSVRGMRMLSEFADALSRQGTATVLVTRPRDSIRRLLGLAGLDRLMTIVDGPSPSVDHVAISSSS